MPADDPPQLYCSNEETRLDWLLPGAVACEFFEHKMLSTEEVARIFGVAEQLVRGLAELWVESGGTDGLRATKIGPKLWRFRREDVFNYLESGHGPFVAV